MAALFDPIAIRGLSSSNRICVSPMSQYAATAGVANDWHFAHLARFALGGAGIVFTEATGITPDGRRTHGDLGLWNDSQESSLSRIAHFLKSQGSCPGIQLAHAGRKASERRPWHGETPVDEDDVRLRGEAPWTAWGPTDEPYGETWPAPQMLSEEGIHTIIDAFAGAAARAERAGFEVIEVYAAHGFLLHQFYSPLCNTRTDQWGGDFEGRTRIVLETAKAIRNAISADLALFFRISATDWLEQGWQVQDSVRLARELKACGVDLIDCSSGGIGGPHPLPRFPLGPAFQADLAQQVRESADVSTMAVGMIWDAKTANTVITEGQADMVAVARELLNNPNWTLHAAAELGVDSDFSKWAPAFGWWLNKRERVFRKLSLGKYATAAHKAE